MSPDRTRRAMTARNVVLGTTIRVTSMALILLLPMVAARIVPPAVVAQVLIAISVGTMLGVIAQVGLPWAIGFRVAQARTGKATEAHVRRDLRSAMAFLAAVLAVLVAFVSLGLPPASVVIPEATKPLMLAVVVTGVSRAASKVVSEVSKGYGDVNVAAIGSDLVGPGLGLVVFIVLAMFWSPTSTLLVWGLALGWVMAVLFTIGRAPVQPTGGPSEKSITKGSLREEMFALSLISVLNVGIQQAHIVMSGWVLGLDEAASFSTAARLATLTGAPLMIIAGLASPDIGLALHSNSSAQTYRVQQRVQRLTGVFFVAAAGLCLLYLVWGGQLLGLLFGSAYSGGHAELVVLAIGPLGSLLAGVAGITLIQAGQRGPLLRDTAVGSTVAIATMLVGSRWGGVGLATGYSCGQLTINALQLRTCRKLTGLSPMANPFSAVAWAISKARASLMTPGGGP